MSAEHFDSYGFQDRVVYESAVFPKDSLGQPDQGDEPFDHLEEKRYIVWIYWSPGDATGQRQTYRTILAAKLAAKLWEYRGYGVKIKDRKIRPGDFGFLARRDSGAYWMEPDGTLHTGTLEEMQDLVKAKGGTR